MPNIELFTAGIRGKRHQQQEKLFTPKRQNRFIFLDNNIESNQADSRAMTVCEYRQAYAKIEASPIPETKWSSSHYIEMLSLRLGTESRISRKKGQKSFSLLAGEMSQANCFRHIRYSTCFSIDWKAICCSKRSSIESVRSIGFVLGHEER